MSAVNVLVVGVPSTALKHLLVFLQSLPDGLPAAVVVTMHVSAGNPGVLPQICPRWCGRNAIYPREGEKLLPGRVYIAPPREDLLIDGDRLRLDPGPPRLDHGPSIIRLFRSAARSQPSRVIACLLAGRWDGELEALAELRALGATTLLQQPEDPRFGSDGMSHPLVAGALPLDVLVETVTCLLRWNPGSYRDDGFEDEGEPASIEELLHALHSSQIRFRRMAEQALRAGLPEIAGDYLDRALRAESRASDIRGGRVGALPEGLRETRIH